MKKKSEKIKNFKKLKIKNEKKEEKKKNEKRNFYQHTIIIVALLQEINFFMCRGVAYQGG